MHILVAGATGFLGKPLCGELIRSGHTVTALSRDPNRAARLLPKEIVGIDWSGEKLINAMTASDAIVNLSGEPIADHRWTAEVKRRLRSSRVDSTRKIVDAMRDSGRTDQVLVNASAVGYYGDTGNREVTETSHPGTGFLAELCVDWESEARLAEEIGARVVLPRMGVVLAEDGGMIEKLLPVFQRGMGGPIGNGGQWLSWIHRADAIRMIMRMVESPAIRGPVNVTSPAPVTMGAFARSFGKALHRPAMLPVPAFALRLMLGEFADSLLTGQKVAPRAASNIGFTWTYPTLEAALNNIVGKEVDEE